MIAFLYYFKKQKSKESNEIYLNDLIKNLQDMLSNSDKFCADISRSYSDYENSLNSDLRFLS